ncbi:MAG: glycosyltransferase [Bacilli bacterium]|nr:glycosyltransferase [Bacilli bacterium]
MPNTEEKRRLIMRTKEELYNNGIFKTIKKIFNYLLAHYKISKSNREYTNIFADVLFINGCSLPHPSRYRVSHQREQLEFCGISTQEVFYTNLTIDQAEKFRCFIFFRCPCTEVVEKFIKKAKSLNKVVYFDIDDLLFDIKYTKTISYIDTMDENHKKMYYSGIQLTQKTLSLCDGAITSTNKLKTELQKYVKNVFVNKNVASEKMLQISKNAIYCNDLGVSLDSKNNAYVYKKYIKIAKKIRKKKGQYFYIGYFSGSITHNDDLEMISEDLAKVMQVHAQVRLCIVGMVDLPKNLLKYDDRIIRFPFSDWRELPFYISNVDLNIIPLVDTTFNQAKSENKWMEASLVKVPSIASNVGALKETIINNQTGILCRNEKNAWFNAIDTLIGNPDSCQKLATNAYNYVMKNYTTLKSSHKFGSYIKSIMKQNFVMVLPSALMSGGALVALKHCHCLKENGIDVSIVVDQSKPLKNITYMGHAFPTFVTRTTKFIANIDDACATLWTTINWLNNCKKIKRKHYLVQNFEPDFYNFCNPNRAAANATYFLDNFDYITISKWCASWLQETYGIKPKYIPNGIEEKLFLAPKIRNFNKNEKIKILIEGSCDDYYKNVDEAFRIANKLDRNKYEIWYMNYRGTTKKWYHIDNFLPRISFDSVNQIYKKCHILLKTSILESFSYPPLEMMATGGFCVIRKNEGNIEYLKNKYNCLTYDENDLSTAIIAIEKIVNDASLRKRLYKNGIQTARERSWKNYSRNIIKAYSTITK